MAGHAGPRGDDKTNQHPAFEVATIKPVAPEGEGVLGFLSYPGGKVVVGASTLKNMMQIAFKLQTSQIKGGASWIGQDRYDVVGIPPSHPRSGAESQQAFRGDPTDLQREMLQSLLIDRFGLQYHWERRSGPAYVLLQSKNKLQITATTSPAHVPRVAFFINADGLPNGEAAGQNVSMKLLVEELETDLGRPVLDRTGLAGSYDFHIAASDAPEFDASYMILKTVARLGLKLKPSKEAIDILAIDRVTRPTEN
ncbi:MAG TPA: TIGR03435 family protein [Edaphobacter sp.]|nr:TIGR03435 family protein [Edaphobacter sp.]